MTEHKIAIVGAGNVGTALAARLAESGYAVTLGVRPGREKAPLASEELADVPRAAVAEACRDADVVFLAVPSKAAVNALSEADLDGKILVDCTNPLGWDDGPVWDPPEEGSVGAQLAAAFPGARVVKGFCTFGAEFHRNPQLNGEGIDVQLASDDRPAKETVSEIARTAGFKPIDAGPLRNGAVLENIAVLWIHLALAEGHGREIAFKLVRRG